MRYLTITLLLMVMVLSGCTTQQQTDLQDTLRIQQTVKETLIQQKAIEDDPNLSHTEKTIKTVTLVADNAVKTGLVPADQKETFLNGLQIALDAYLAYAPLGAKMDWTLLVAIALLWLKNRKKPI